MELNLDNLSMKDLHDYLDMRENHKQEFETWTKEHSYAGADDELDNDLELLQKTFTFFYNRNYII